MVAPPLLAPRDFVADPQAMARGYSPAEAARYTRWLATSHYENFRIVSFLLPRDLHQDFYNVYSFCRWADDLGDEIGDPAESLRLLDWWHEQLLEMFDGRARHPVFVALEDTVRRHQLPIAPFADLISAFEQDQTVTRYETLADLVGYCRYSANPVGRLVLLLCGYRDEERLKLSDATCTGLQLANFWQDVRRDLDKGRVYIPLESIRKHGYSLERLERREFNHAFRALMQDLIGVARRYFAEGLPLAGMVRPRLALDIELFSRGGLKILERIEAQRCNVLFRRPVVTRWDRFAMLARTLPRLLRRRTP